MKQSSKQLYLFLQYTRDLCLVLQLFMLPFIYFFFKTSYGYAYGLSFVSSVWFLILVILFAIYVVSFISIIQIEKNGLHDMQLNELKNNRYSSKILAGCILTLSLINLVIFIFFTIFSLIHYQTSLGIYKENFYLIIIHIEILILTLSILLRLNNLDHKRYLPLIDLFQNESIADHKVIKKPLL